MSTSLRPQDPRGPPPIELDRSAAAAAWSSPPPAGSRWSVLADTARVERLVDRLNGQVARDPQGFVAAARLAFDDKADLTVTNALIDAARADRLPMPEVRFVEPGALGTGTLGAYAAGGGGTILLDRSLLGDESRLEAVFTEEWGHHVDALLGGADSAGDEGAIFSQALLGPGGAGGMTPSRLDALRRESDRGLLLLDGRWRVVEHYDETPGDTAGLNGGPGSGTTGGGYDPSGYGNGSKPGGKTGDKPEPEPAPAPAPTHVNQPPVPGIQPVTPAPTPTPTPTPVAPAFNPGGYTNGNPPIPGLQGAPAPVPARQPPHPGDPARGAPEACAPAGHRRGRQRSADEADAPVRGGRRRRHPAERAELVAPSDRSWRQRERGSARGTARDARARAAARGATVAGTGDDAATGAAAAVRSATRLRAGTRGGVPGRDPGNRLSVTPDKYTSERTRDPAGG